MFVMVFSPRCLSVPSSERPGRALSSWLYNSWPLAAAVPILPIAGRRAVERYLSPEHLGGSTETPLTSIASNPALKAKGQQSLITVNPKCSKDL